MFNIPNPPQGWANPSDCVDFTCTGLYNVVMRLESPQYNGDFTPSLPFSTYSIISNNIESISAQVIPDCKFVEDWNAYRCDDDNIGVLIFDSRDADRMDRASQPIYIQNYDMTETLPDSDLTNTQIGI